MTNQGLTDEATACPTDAGFITTARSAGGLVSLVRRRWEAWRLAKHRDLRHDRKRRHLRGRGMTDAHITRLLDLVCVGRGCVSVHVDLQLMAIQMHIEKYATDHELLVDAVEMMAARHDGEEPFEFGDVTWRLARMHEDATMVPVRGMDPQVEWVRYVRAGFTERKAEMFVHVGMPASVGTVHPDIDITWQSDTWVGLLRTLDGDVERALAWFPVAQNPGIAPGFRRRAQIGELDSRFGAEVGLLLLKAGISYEEAVARSWDADALRTLIALRGGW